MDATAQATAYLIYVWIRGIHPMLWRRFLVRAESTLADLHCVIQIGFGWTDFHEDLPGCPARKSGEEWQLVAKRR